MIIYCDSIYKGDTSKVKRGPSGASLTPRKSQSGIGAASGRSRDVYDLFLVSVLAMLNDYVCLATQNASSASEMRAVCDVAKAYYERQMGGPAARDSAELSAVKVGSSNASRTQGSKDPVVLYREARGTSQQLESFLGILYLY